MVAMNLAEPSGSSPELKPPGSMRICDWRIAVARAVRDSSTASGVRLRKTRVSVLAPACSKTAAVSYSQLVPGKTGITTLGFPVMRRRVLWERLSLVTAAMVGASEEAAAAEVVR